MITGATWLYVPDDRIIRNDSFEDLNPINIKKCKKIVDSKNCINNQLRAFGKTRRQG